MGTVTLIKPSYSNIGTNNVSISYSTSGWSLPSSSTNTSDNVKTVVSYKGLSYSWSFTANGYSQGTSTSVSGSFGYHSLGSGASNTCTASVSVTCTKTTTITKEDGTSSSTTSTASVGSASSSVIVYCKPTSWSWGGVAKGKEISNYITAAKWNDLANWAGKYLSWKNLSDYYSKYTSLKVSSGVTITASLYNSMAAACGKSVSTVKAGDTILASHFTALETS